MNARVISKPSVLLIFFFSDNIIIKIWKIYLTFISFSNLELKKPHTYGFYHHCEALHTLYNSCKCLKISASPATTQFSLLISVKQLPPEALLDVVLSRWKAMAYHALQKLAGGQHNIANTKTSTTKQVSLCHYSRRFDNKHYLLVLF